jgi:DNA ligase-1
MQAHFDGKELKLYTRRMEDVTKQFPDVVKNIKRNVKGKNFILDCEAVGYSSKTEKYLPFQKISQRIRRKYETEDMAKKFPVELNVFDIIYYEGEKLTDKNFDERRKLLEKIVNEENKKIVLSKLLITDNAKKVEKFFKDSLKAGHEGLMFKSLNAKYKPGR